MTAPIVRVVDAKRRIVTVPIGTLVIYEPLGIAVNANYNEPEFREQPYVTISSEQIDDRFASGADGADILVELDQVELYDGQPAGAAPGADADACAGSVSALSPADDGEQV